jgi:hypothetical protein
VPANSAHVLSDLGCFCSTPRAMHKRQVSTTGLSPHTCGSAFVCFSLSRELLTLFCPSTMRFARVQGVLQSHVCGSGVSRTSKSSVTTQDSSSQSIRRICEASTTQSFTMYIIRQRGLGSTFHNRGSRTGIGSTEASRNHWMASPCQARKLLELVVTYGQPCRVCCPGRFARTVRDCRTPVLQPVAGQLRRMPSFWWSFALGMFALGTQSLCMCGVRHEARSSRGDERKRRGSPLRAALGRSIHARNSHYMIPLHAITHHYMIPATRRAIANMMTTTATKNIWFFNNHTLMLTAPW